MLDYTAHELVEKEIALRSRVSSVLTVAFPRGPDRPSPHTLAVRRARKFSTVSIFWAGSVFDEEKEGSAAFPSRQVENRRKRSIAPEGPKWATK